MTDTILIQNNKTQAYEIKQLGYYLPDYDIGDIAAFKPDAEKDFIESAIVGISMEVLTIRNEVVTQVYYLLECGADVLQEDIEYYFSSSEEQEANTPDEIDVNPYAWDNLTVLERNYLNAYHQIYTEIQWNDLTPNQQDEFIHEMDD